MKNYSIERMPVRRKLARIVSPRKLLATIFLLYLAAITYAVIYFIN